MRLVKTDDGLLDVLVKIVTAVGVLFGAWVYFHTIYPVFTKEKDLIDAKHEVETLRTQRDAQQAAIATNAKIIRTQGQQIESQRGELRTLQQVAASTRAEADRIRRQLAEEQSHAQQAETAAIESHLVRYRDKIVREGIDRQVSRAFDQQAEPFDARAYTLKFVQQERGTVGTADSQAERTEIEALRILEQFARQKLTSHSEYGDIFDLTIFFLQEQQRAKGGA